MEDNLRINIIDEIAKSSGYDIALMTTFNFDISFFERAVLSQLSAQNINKVTLFVDSKELIKSISDVSSCNIGRRYMVNPMLIDGAFHPKLILLLGEDKAKLFIGSANITTSGMSVNNEAFNVIEYSAKKPDYLDVINDAIHFFLDINSISYQLDRELLEEIEQLNYYHRANENGVIKLIHNLDTPLLNQIQKYIKDPVKEIRVAVPYYDNSLSALSEMVSAFPDAKTFLYLQNSKCSFSKKSFAGSGLQAHTLVYEGFKDNQLNGHNNFYHGKVFSFKTDNAAYMLYGSSNCTQAALMKTYEHGGNIECDIIETGKPNDFNYYFKAFDTHERKNFETQLLSYDVERKSNYHYKYGVVNDDAILLYISRSNSKDIEIFIDGGKLQYDVSDNELIVTIPKEIAQDLPEVFEITIKDDDKEVSLHCWTYCLETINTYRQRRSDKYSLELFEYNSESDKFIQDRINLINAETMCLPDIQEYNKKIALLNQIRQEQEDNDKGDEEFIVDVDILDEYKRSYRQINMVDRIREVFYRRLINDSRALFAYGKTEQKHDQTNEEPHHQIIRTATSEERRFERFVKNRVKGMVNKEFVDIITPQHYLGIVAVVLDIFAKYRSVEIFDAEYVIETRSKLYETLLKREKWDETDNQINDVLLRNCFCILMDNYIYSFGLDSMEERDYVNSLNRSLLTAMEKRFSIRSNYQDTLINMMDPNSDDSWSIVPNSFYNYIEDLFGYKNYDLLVQFIESLYADADVKEIDGRFQVIGKTENIVTELKPNQLLLKEIRNYSRNVAPVKKISIKITPLFPNQSGSKIIEIDHVVDLLLHNWRCTVVYADGTRLDEKPEFISI